MQGSGEASGARRRGEERRGEERRGEACSGKGAARASGKGAARERQGSGTEESTIGYGGDGTDGRRRRVGRDNLTRWDESGSA